MKHFSLKIWAKQIVMLCSLVALGLQEVVAQFQSGDVFVAVASGQVQRRSAAGALLQTLNTGQGGFTTGMAFDATGNCYVTNFSASSVSKFDNNGVLLGTFGSGYSTPESILFDAAGNAYVGNVGNGIRKYDATGVFIETSYAGRVDWIDLAADQCTMLRTTEGTTIERHNVCTNTALSTFASGLGGEAFALRIRQNGEVLLANGPNVLRLDASGNILQTYTVSGENSWFALNLSPDGTSFWSANFNTANVYRIDIATGNVLSSFNTGTGASTVFGLAVYGEFQVAVCANNTAPAFISPTPSCGSTIQAFAGTPVNFTIAASDANAGDIVSLNVSGLPSGATMTPALPANGNPVSSNFSWTPTIADAGPHVITYTIADRCVEVTCTLTINVQASCVTQAVCKNASVTLVNGSATVTAADVDGGSTATCGIKSLTVAPCTFTCSNIGDNNVVLTVTDVNGTTSTCNAVVTVTGTIPSCSITAVPSSAVYTGGVPTNIYLGYGPQSVKLNVNAASGAPFTYSWTGAGALSCTNCAAPVFAPTAAGTYNFTVTVTNTYGCKTTCSIRVCVLDIRDGTDGKKVFICHVPPGNPPNPQTLSIDVSAVPSHLLLHSLDRLGKCGQVPCGTVRLARSGVVSEVTAEAAKVVVLPNPNAGQFSVQLNNLKGSKADVAIINANGATIEKRAVLLNESGNGKVLFNIKTESSVMYFIKVFSDGGVLTERVVIKH